MKIGIPLTFLCISTATYAIDGTLVNFSGRTVSVVLKDAQNNPLIQPTQIHDYGSMELEVLDAGNDYTFIVNYMAHYPTVSGITSIETTLPVAEPDNFYIDEHLKVKKFEQAAAAEEAPAG